MIKSFKIFNCIKILIFMLFFSSSSFSTTIGDDGLHKEPWLRETFKDMPEDLAEAIDENKRLLIIFEQRGCIYCRKMHEEVFSDPIIKKKIEDDFFVVQMNLFGDLEVTDFDGETLSEKKMAAKWNIFFTPTMLFLPKTVPNGSVASKIAAVTMPGAFRKGTTYHLLNWVTEEGYLRKEHFQKYVARKIKEK